MLHSFFTFQHMKTSEEAELAIEHLRGQVLNGNTLTIEASTSRPRGGGGGSGGGRSSAAGSSDRYSPRSSAWEGSVTVYSESDCPCCVGFAPPPPTPAPQPYLPPQFLIPFQLLSLNQNYFTNFDAG